MHASSGNVPVHVVLKVYSRGISSPAVPEKI